MKNAIAQQLFDASGRRIPPAGVGAVNKGDARYALPQPALDFAAIHARLAEYTGGRLPSSVEFRDRAESLLALLRATDEVAPLTTGTHLPFALAAGAPGDLGATFESVYLPALGRSWKARFPKYDFKSEVKNLAGRVSIAPGSRYERLVNAMADGPVVGWYFPLALSGFSVDAALAQVAELPGAFVLAGGFEAAAALTGCPEAIMKVDGYAPQLDLSGWRAPADRYAYHFAPYGYNLTFNGRYHNGQASDYCSSGLTVIAGAHGKL